MPWSFVDYVSATGGNPIRKCLDSLSVSARAKIDDRILQMSNLERWPEKWASSYKGYDKIIELRIKADKVQYRPLGMHHPTRRMCFVLLHGAIEKGEIPKSDLEVAKARRDEIRVEPRRVVDHDY